MNNQIRIYYDAESGHIKRQIASTNFPEYPDPYIVVDERIKINDWRVDVTTQSLVEKTPTVTTPIEPTWSDKRRRAYGPIFTQMNMLWDDIDAGHLGEQAKQGRWYLALQAIKQRIPKP